MLCTAKSVRLLFASLLLGFGASIAQADDIVTLDTWNVADIQASGDIVKVVIGYDAILNVTNVTFQWQEGSSSDGLWTAIGLDTIFYNSTQYAAVVKVIENGVDTTADWKLNFGGSTSGGGFGSFNSKKNLESGGNGGIEPDYITFVFNGLVTFVNNGDPTYATFAAHVRYGNDCSGWVSDGNTGSDTTSTTTCAPPTRVPEPATLGLFGLGLLGIAFTRRRLSARVG